MKWLDDLKAKHIEKKESKEIQLWNQILTDTYIAWIFWGKRSTGRYRGRAQIKIWGNKQMMDNLLQTANRLVRRGQEQGSDPLKIFLETAETLKIRYEILKREKGRI